VQEVCNDNGSGSGSSSSTNTTIATIIISKNSCKEFIHKHKQELNCMVMPHVDKKKASMYKKETMFFPLSLSLSLSLDKICEKELIGSCEVVCV